ncbi:probable phosphoglycerate mutase [Edaphobacillus lindanitolerans]|uniref:Probable phosphoglycerate mutase n=2 Tax=Edaphobacillus lindanitolerans TaxID=550447 RepID=A0A1U7PKC3_9BACI|nr:probable phosphoglycerate mutase [Edaphobacillus lindanitolerans]
MKTIGFVRHGITEWNKERRWQGATDIPLAEEGVREAHLAASRLAEEDWEIIYASPLKRARETAEIIREAIPGIDLRFDERLKEVYGGNLEGTTEEERVKKWGTDWRIRAEEYGMESDSDMTARGMAFLEEVRKLPEERILIVSHGGFISRMLKAMTPEREYTERLLNTSLTVVELRDDRNLCTLYNCTKHLNA